MSIKHFIKNFIAISFIYFTLLVGTLINALLFPFRALFNPSHINFSKDEFEDLMFERSLAVAADCVKLYSLIMGYSKE